MFSWQKKGAEGIPPWAGRRFLARPEAAHFLKKSTPFLGWQERTSTRITWIQMDKEEQHF
jgi:hypothetical protein